MIRHISLFIFTIFTLLSLSAQAPVVTHGDRDRTQICITIDDGWVPDWDLIHFLEEEEVPFTAFIPGKIAAMRPDWVRYLSEKGIRIGNHGYLHHGLSGMTEEEIRDDLKRAKETLEDLTGEFYPYLRPPGGLYDERVLNIASEMGYTVVMWENDVLGYWKDSTIESQLDYLYSKLQNGNIILSHFGQSLHTEAVFRIFIPKAREMGYEFVTLDELLEEKDGEF